METDIYDPKVAEAILQFTEEFHYLFIFLRGLFIGIIVVLFSFIGFIMIDSFKEFFKRDK